MNFKVDLNQMKEGYKARGLVFADGVFEKAIKEFAESNTDENGNFKEVLGEFNRDYENEGHTTRLAKVSHRITGVNTDEMTADIEILDTPCGKVVKDLVCGKSVQGLVSQGLCHTAINAVGSVTRDNVVEEIDQLLSIDFEPDINIDK